jgi:hypothetical protein
VAAHVNVVVADSIALMSVVCGSRRVRALKGRVGTRTDGCYQTVGRITMVGSDKGRGGGGGGGSGGVSDGSDGDGGI